MAHGCVHDAADFWPPGATCEECSGAAGLSNAAVAAPWVSDAAEPCNMHDQQLCECAVMPHVWHRLLHAGLPEEVAHTKQALARGYAVLAIDSKNRDFNNRCFRCGAWAVDCADRCQLVCSSDSSGRRCRRSSRPIGEYEAAAPTLPPHRPWLPFLACSYGEDKWGFKYILENWTREKVGTSGRRSLRRVVGATAHAGAAAPTGRDRPVALVTRHSLNDPRALLLCRG